MPIVERYINGNVEFWEVDELRLCGTCKHFSPEEPGGFDECSRVTTMKFFTLVTGEEYTRGNTCLNSCVDERSSSSPIACGIEGKHWEAKE